MAVIYRFRVELNGWVGAPGVNTFWGLGFEEGSVGDAEVNNFGQGLKALYASIKTTFALNISAHWDGTADLLNIADAALVDRIGGLTQWTEQAPVSSGNMSRATQIKMQYKTDKIRNRRFLTGGVFHGPLTTTALDGAGQVAATARTLYTNAYGGLLDVIGVNLAVYGQPTKPETPPGGPVPPNNADGVAGYVQSVDVMSRPAVLRRRRD
jgi:hypothetical protein